MNRSALKIYSKLLKDGQLDSSSDSELFLEYRKPEVNEELYEMGEELGFTVLDVGKTIYFIPDMGNEMFNYSSKELRNSISATARTIDVYLQSYIIMYIMFMFYGGKNNQPIQLEFLRIRTLIENLDEHFKKHIEADEGLENLKEEKYQINFRKIAEYWTDKKVFDEGKIKDKYGTVMKVCKFLQRERLVHLVENDTEIRPTKRLNDIFVNYYLSEERIDSIHRLFESEE